MEHAQSMIGVLRDKRKLVIVYDAKLVENSRMFKVTLLFLPIDYFDCFDYTN